MNLVGIRQLDPENLLKNTFDAIFCASGSESRAPFVAKYVAKSGGTTKARKIVFGYEETPMASRPNNDAMFTKLDYEMMLTPGGTVAKVEKVFRDVMATLPNQRNPRILVDISNMSRIWYGTILQAMANMRESFEKVEVVFTYAPGSYTEPSKEPGRIIDMMPIRGYSSVNDPHKPSALLLGLGYEEGRAEAVFNYIDPAVAYAWYADPTLAQRYVTTVLKANAGLLKNLGGENIISYPLVGIEHTAMMLDSLCVGLLNNYRVSLVPLGPKPFTLLCLLVALRHRDICVWRPILSREARTIDRKPCGIILTVNVSFSGNQPEVVLAEERSVAVKM